LPHCRNFGISEIRNTPQAQFNPLSILKGAVEAAVEDRSSDDIANDLEIKTAITSKMVDKMGSDVVSINADVYEQDVMLTGSVETAAQRKQAGALARRIKGVKNVTKVTDCVKVAPK